MSYEDERHGDRGIMRGESDYDEFDELAGMDVDLLQELGLVMAPMTAAPTTTSRCPTDERYDEIEQMCVPVQTSTGTSITRLRAQLQTTAPTMVMAPTVSPTTSKCPPGEEWDRIEGNCRVLPTDPAPTSPTRQLYTKYRAIAPTSVTVAPVKPRDAPVSSSAHPPPDAVRAADVLIKAPAPPKLPSYSSPFKGGRAAAVSVDHRAAPKPVSAQMLQMPVAPPAGGKVVGLSTGAKIGIGIGAGALLLYIMTRK